MHVLDFLHRWCTLSFHPNGWKWRKSKLYEYNKEYHCFYYFMTIMKLLTFGYILITFRKDVLNRAITPDKPAILHRKAMWKRRRTADWMLYSTFTSYSDITNLIGNSTVIAYFPSVSVYVCRDKDKDKDNKRNSETTAWYLKHGTQGGGGSDAGSCHERQVGCVVRYCDAWMNQLKQRETSVLRMNVSPYPGSQFIWSVHTNHREHFSLEASFVS